MTVSGKVSDCDWSVSVEVIREPDGFVPEVHVVHRALDGKFERRFKHHKTFRTESEAVLEGLREGMSWVRQKMENLFSL